MEISNKTLAMFLLAAIVISIAGTIFSIDRLNSISSITGYATTETGNVTLNVGSVLSITTADDNLIDFGTCTPVGGTDATITSEVANGGLSPNDICSAFTADEILIRNDGNVDANVTINASDYGDVHSGTFLDTARDVSWIAYKITNDSSNPSYGGGCNGSYQSAYVNITNSANSYLLGCDDLRFGSENNSIEFDIQIMVPYDYSGGTDDVVFTFVAQTGS